MENDKQRQKQKRHRAPIPPPPFSIEHARTIDFLSLTDVGGFLRKSTGAIKKHLDGRPDGSKDEIGLALQPMICKPFGRDRYIKARLFCDWYLSRQRPA